MADVRYGELRRQLVLNYIYSRGFQKLWLRTLLHHDRDGLLFAELIDAPGDVCNFRTCVLGLREGEQELLPQGVLLGGRTVQDSDA